MIRDSRVSVGGRLLAGVVGLAVCGVPVRGTTIGPIETAAFRAVNDRSDRWYRPVWVVMQSGNVLAAPVVATVALGCGRPRLAARLAITGGLTWTAAKIVKRIYRRPRPAALVAGVRGRGPEASGLGYVSGHAGIATGIAAALLPEVGGPLRLVPAALAPAVALSRIYVGAHLPLDVVGGAALGLVVDAVVSSVVDSVVDGRNATNGCDRTKARTSSSRRMSPHPSTARNSRTRAGWRRRK